MAPSCCALTIAMSPSPSLAAHPLLPTTSSQVLKNTIFPISRSLHMLHTLPKILFLFLQLLVTFFGSQVFYFPGEPLQLLQISLGVSPAMLSPPSPSTYHECQLINFPSSLLDLKLVRLCPTPNPRNSPQILKYT